MATALAKKKTNKPVIVQYLERYKDQIAMALPKHMTADRMSRIMLTEVRKVPKLLNCDPQTLFGAVIQASQLGLEPGNALGQVYLLPYGKTVQLIIGYKGMIDLARRSGQIISIEARSVHSNDDFSYSFGLNPDLKHTPAAGDRGELTHVYAVARLKDGGLQWDVMSKTEVEEIRKISKAANNGPWVTHFGEMAKKTVIRRLFKYLPVSVEIQTAMGLDEQADAGVVQHNEAVITGEFLTIDDLDDGGPEPETKTEGVGQIIKNKLKAGGEKVNTETGEVTGGDSEDAGPTLAEISKTISGAATSAALDLACDVISLLPKKDQAAARKLATAKRAELEG